MRIATFNANSIRTRLDTVCAWLREHAPDILAIQETKVTDDLFPAAAFEAMGYTAVFRGEKAYNGVAIVSRNAPDAVRYGFDDGRPADATRLLRARFGDLWIVNTYVPQGREIAHPMYARKIEWFSRLLGLFAREHDTGSPVLWLGDLNVARTPDDLHDPGSHADHVCFHRAVREAFERVLAWGFDDVFRQFHRGPGHFTFYDYRAPHALERGRGWRIDYLLATAPLAKQARDAFIDLAPRRAPRPSDHTFLVGDFAR